ncbi:hypothetical protein VHARVF571_200116 [Vibrio harveyi]|nr:hypothetical protein VHARVF571_200116 [Vibrio harveyi]
MASFLTYQNNKNLELGDRSHHPVCDASKARPVFLHLRKISGYAGTNPCGLVYSLNA